MAWTGQAFTVGQILTAAQMTNLQNDITAAFAKDSGAPTLANLYVVEAMINTGAVTANKIGTGAVTQGKLATDSVTTVKIVDSAVTQTKIAPNAVGTSELINSNVTEAKLAAAVSAQLVTNGDTHNHAGGDGDPIPAASVTGLSETGVDSVASVNYHYMIRNESSVVKLGNRVHIGGINTTSYTKVLESLTPISGTYTVRLGLNRTAGTAYAKIYVNGVSVGTERSSTTGGFIYWNEDVTVVAGDLIQIYRYQTVGGVYGAAAEARMQIGSSCDGAFILRTGFTAGAGDVLQEV